MDDGVPSSVLRGISELQHENVIKLLDNAFITGSSKADMNPGNTTMSTIHNKPVLFLAPSDSTNKSPSSNRNKPNQSLVDGQDNTGIHALNRKRMYIIKAPIPDPRVPCYLINYRAAGSSEIFFPVSRQLRVVGVFPANYNVVGQSTPGVQNGNWFVMFARSLQSVVFFDGDRQIPLPEFPYIPGGTVLASFWGNPDSGCEVLIVEFIDDRIVRTLYCPHTNMWVGPTTFYLDFPYHQPMGQVTTSLGFSWVEAHTGFLYTLEHYWDRDRFFDRPRVAHLGVDDDPIGGADMICSIIHDSELYCMVVLMDMTFSLYRLGRLIRQIDPQVMRCFEMLPYQLSPGQNIFASPCGPGLLTTVQEDEQELSQKVFLSTWNCDCLMINGGEGLPDPEVIKDCYFPIDDDCHCKSYVVLLGEVVEAF